MAPPPRPRRTSYDHYIGHNPSVDFGIQNSEPPISLPPVHSTETPLLTPLDLLPPPESLRPGTTGSPLVEMLQNLSAMQNTIAQRLLLAKEYDTSLAIEGAFRKAEWERDRVRRMSQSTNATKSTPYIDWNPVSAVAQPPAHKLPSTTANRPQSRTTTPVTDPTSMAESPLIENPNLYYSPSVSTTQSASTIQDPLPTASDKVPLTIQHHIPNPLTGISDPYHATISVPSSISLNDLKQVVWNVIQDGVRANARQALALNGWIESLVVHWDIDKQVCYHFPCTTELRDESMESMLVCLRDVRGYDWVEVGFQTS